MYKQYKNIILSLKDLKIFKCKTLQYVQNRTDHGQKKTKLYTYSLMETTIEDDKPDVESGSLRFF